MCTATNGVGQPAMAAIDVNVLCKLLFLHYPAQSILSGMSSYLPISADSPEVSLHQQYEHSATDKGITIKIDCVAHGNPSPQVCDTFPELEKIKEVFRSMS